MVGNRKGFTLIEVLAVTAIVVMVLAGILSFSIFGQKLFHSGARQGDLHSSVRLATERVIREVRYARDIMLLGETWDPSGVDTTDYTYIYHDSTSQTLMLLDSSGSRPLSNQIVSGVSFQAQGSMLLFTIHGENRSSSFTLDSSVQPMNVSGGISGPSSSSALCFSLPAVGAMPEPDPEDSGESEDPDPPDPGPDPPEESDPPYTQWNESTVYYTGDRVTQDGRAFEAKWYTQGANPLTNSGQWDVWKEVFDY